jgi:hypothetical protein
MVQFILKIILSVFTGILDMFIENLTFLLALLLWEERCLEIPNFIFTRMFWNKVVNITENK